MKREYMRELVLRVKERARALWLKRNAAALYFVPGAFLIALAFVMVLMPRLFIFFVAGLLLAAGLLLCYLAYKFLVLRKRVEAIVKDLSGRVVIHGLEIQDPFDFEHSAEGKKIVYH